MHGASLAEEEDSQEPNFFLNAIHDQSSTWNAYYRSQEINIPMTKQDFLTPCYDFFIKVMQEYADDETNFSGEITRARFLNDIQPLIDTLFVHLNRYYYLLDLYGRTCYGVNDVKPEGDFPEEYQAYVRTIKNECRYLSLLILKHCYWGGGDCYIVGDEQHFDDVNAWEKKYLTSIPHLPDVNIPFTPPAIYRTLSENATNQFAIKFSYYEPDKMFNHMVFSYTNMLANLHLYINKIPLREEASGRSPLQVDEIDNQLAAALIIQQQDEWSKIIQLTINELTLPNCLGYFGTAAGFKTSNFSSRQLALLNYFSGDLMNMPENAPDTELTSADSAKESTDIRENGIDEGADTSESTTAPARLLPPLFVLGLWLLNLLFSGSTRRNKQTSTPPGNS